jgi:hypothetical protein
LKPEDIGDHSLVNSLEFEGQNQTISFVKNLSAVSFCTAILDKLSP